MLSGYIEPLLTGQLRKPLPIDHWQLVIQQLLRISYRTIPFSLDC